MKNEEIRSRNSALVAALKSDVERINRVRNEALRLRDALKSAVRIAAEAREEWDKAPNGMRAGKILIALAGGCSGYRPDIDEIHAAIRAVEGGGQ